jgi:hypothetical protein
LYSALVNYKWNKAYKTPMQEKTVLSCHRCLVMTCVDKMNNI